MSYTIKKGQQGEEVLNINGFQSVCPYVAPLPFQGQMGQVQIIRMPCSTLCPHASIKENDYHITCGANHTLTFKLEQNPEIPAKPNEKGSGLLIV
jgi:hypothetical protein